MLALKIVRLIPFASEAGITPLSVFNTRPSSAKLLSKACTSSLPLYRVTAYVFPFSTCTETSCVEGMSMIASARHQHAIKLQGYLLIKQKQQRQDACKLDESKLNSQACNCKCLLCDYKLCHTQDTNTMRQASAARNAHAVSLCALCTASICASKLTTCLLHSQNLVYNNNK